MTPADPDRTRTAVQPGAFYDPLPADPPAAPGYDLVGEIARGGMGVVYRARQRGTGRDVALKTFAPGRTLSDAERARFRAEVEAVAALDHPGIVPVYEVGEAGGVPFFTMKLVPGRSLAAALADPDWLPSRKDRARLVAKVARAVHHAHQRGVIHRDLKPANVLLDEAGGPHVADFGLAKRAASDADLTRTGAVLGTPAYLSPEQAGGDGKAVTTQTDVHALGVVLYELLTGRRPFAADTPLGLVRQVCDTPPAAPGVDPDVDAVCLKCLAKVPGERYPSAAALADDLERWAAGTPVSVRPPGLAYQIAKWVRGNFGVTARVVAIGLACGLAGAWAVLRSTVSHVIYNAVTIYDWFPSEPVPHALQYVWAALGGVSDSPVVPTLAALLVTGQGLLVAAAIRSKGAWADLIAGVGVGSVAGLVFTPSALLPILIVGFVINSGRETEGDLAAGYFGRTWPPQGTPAGWAFDPGPPPPGRLVERYPDLAGMTPHQQSQFLPRLLDSKRVAGIVEAVSVTVVGFLGVVTGGVVASLAGGWAWRRGGGAVPVVAAYLGLVALLSPAAWTGLATGISGMTSSGLSEQYSVSAVTWAFAGLGLAGAVGLYTAGRWVRWPAAVLCLLMFWSAGFAAAGAFVPFAWPLGVIGSVYACVVSGFTYLIAPRPTGWFR